MIKNYSKYLAVFADKLVVRKSALTGKGRSMALALFFVIFVSVLTSIVINTIYTQGAEAAPNSTVNFQARILKNTGALVADGNYSIQFKVYDSLAGPTSQWNETQVVTIKNGYASVALGSSTPFGSSVDWSQEQWLTMNINGDGEMAPRMKVTAVPLAFRAVQADTLTSGSGTISASQLAQLASGTVQSVNSANSGLRINQTGAGGLLQLQGNGSDVLTLNKTGDLSIASGLTVGNSSLTTAGTIRWNGTAFEGYNGFVWTPLGTTGPGSLVSIVKPSNEIVNNSAALQDDDNLTFPIGANEEWTYRFVIQANAGTVPDLRFAVSAPVGATCRVSYSDPEGATSNGQYGCGVSTALIAGNGAVDLYEITGSVTNGATPGSVTLRWAQFVANASNTTVYAGSYVHAIRSIGAGDSGQVFVQDGNAFGQQAILGTSDSNSLGLITNSAERLTITAGGNVGIGDTTPSALFTVGTGDALQVNSSGNLLTSGTLEVGGLTKLNSSLVASGQATGTTATTEPTPRTNVGTITLTAGAFANNDVLFINNAGQDYYTRIVSGGGTANLVVSPNVSYDAGATVTKYNVQNIGATATDYSTLNNRFFQGYFLGGVVIGAGSTTISDGSISSTTTLRLQEGGGDISIGGALNVTGTITGDASGLTNIDASQITGGAVSDSNLSANVTLLGNTFNGNNQLLQLNGTGGLPALNASNLTDINGTNISSGTVADARLTSNVTLLGNTFNGASQLLQLNASGKVADSLLSSNITAQGNTFNGVSQLVQLDGSGYLPSLNGGALTSLNGTNISTGTVADARLTSNVTLLGNTFNGASQLLQLDGAAGLPALNGSALTSLNATNASSGTLADARLTSNVTLLGNTFNGSNQLLQLDGAGALPTLNGSALTTLNATNISSGTVADARLSSNVCINGSTACGFILLASGTAQIDSSTNSSLFINKTGASGDILTLQDNGANVFSVGNDGALTILSTNTGALAIKNAGGTEFFTVDTSGAIVRVGSSTIDGNATLLVLDTKNTAGDPAGVDGASYYNSNAGANRCYENGIWKNCISETTVVKTANQSVTNSAVFANDTNLAFPMAANSYYTFKTAINYSSTSQNADFKFTFTVPAGATVFITANYPVAGTDGATTRMCNISASGTTCTVPMTAANYRGTIMVTGYVQTAGTAGNTQFQFAQNVQTNGQSVTVYQGSEISYRRTRP